MHMSDNQDGRDGYEAANLRRGCADCGRSLASASHVSMGQFGDFCIDCFRPGEDRRLRVFAAPASHRTAAEAAALGRLELSGPGVPPDARVVGACDDFTFFDGPRLSLLVWSREFEPVPDRTPVPAEPLPRGASLSIL